MFGAVEMPTHEALKSRPETLGKQHHRKTHHAEQHHQGLGRETSRSTEFSRDLSQHPDEHEIPARQNQRQRSLQYRPRRIEIEVSKAGARVTHANQQTRQEQTHRTQPRQIRIVGRKQQRLTQTIELQPKDDRSSQKQIFDPPADHAHRGPECFLQVGERPQSDQQHRHHPHLAGSKKAYGDLVFSHGQL